MSDRSIYQPDCPQCGCPMSIQKMGFPTNGEAQIWVHWGCNNCEQATLEIFESSHGPEASGDMIQ